MENENKLSFWEIVFSPFATLKNMVTSNSDVTEDIELNINSSDKIEAVLAKSFEGIDEEVQNHKVYSKPREIVDKTKVKVKAKSVNKEKETANKNQIIEKSKDDNSRIR